MWRQHERKRKVETVSLRVIRGIARVGYGEKIKRHEMKVASKRGVLGGELTKGQSSSYQINVVKCCKQEKGQDQLEFVVTQQAANATSAMTQWTQRQ